MTEWKLVPVEPDESQWGGLARKIIMAWDMGCDTPRKLFGYLGSSGNPIPQWLQDEPEMQNLAHVPSKGTRAAIIYRAMIEAAPQPPKLSDERILEIWASNSGRPVTMGKARIIAQARAIEREILGGGE